jgi:transposase
MVKLAVRPLRAERDRLAHATVRFETAPGRQAQVDWGSTWAQIGTQRVRVQLFVLVLGYSRRLYLEWTREQTLSSLLTCHHHAVDWFGGLTEEILYDNPQTIVLKRDGEGRGLAWHPQFWDFAQYYGVMPRLCRPCRAQTKGKVEAGIQSVKRRFVQGRPFPTWDALNPMAQEWGRCIGAPRGRSRGITRGPSWPPIAESTASINCAWIPSTSRPSGRSGLGRSLVKTGHER